jgi:putative aldouronate transport system substrate-binding protein
MIKRKRVACLLLCLALLTIVFSSCAESPNESPSTNPLQDEKVTELSVFINHFWYAVDSFSGIIPEEITKRTGIHLSVTVANDRQHINQVIASGDLPDLIYSSEKLDQLSDPAVSYCYDDLIEQYDTGWEIDTAMRANAQALSPDGKIYTLLNHYSKTEDWKDVVGAAPMVGSMLMRRDIYEKVGSPPISTIEDIDTLLDRVQEEFPQMSMYSFDTVHRFNVLRVWFGLGNTFFVETADEGYVHYAQDSRYKDMLSWLNSLYRKGYLLAENFVAESDLSGNLYKKGLCFLMSSCTQDANLKNQSALQLINPLAVSVEMAPLEGSLNTVSDIGWSGTFITKDNAHPEESIRFLQWMFTPEAQTLTQWGREGVDYVPDADGKPIFSKDFRQATLDDTLATQYNPWFYFGGSAIVEAVGRYAVLDPAVYETPYSEIREIYQNQPWITAALPSGDSQERETFRRISDTLNDYEMNIVLTNSDFEFEETWNAFQQDLSLMGIDALNKYMCEKIPLIYKQYQK